MLSVSEMVPSMFSFFGALASWVGLSDSSFNGSFLFFPDSKAFVSLFYLSVFVVGLVGFSESKSSVIVLGNILSMCGLLFFVSTNFFLLYIFFEVSLFPMIFMILMDGVQIEKLSASLYLFIYASVCSFPFLLVILYFELFTPNYVEGIYSWEIATCFLVGFLVKLPLYVMHLWLPKAHVEAPTYGSIILAGLLLKLGGAGLLRVMIFFNFTDVTILFLFCVLGMVLGVLICSFQSDAKALVAYSSVTHMNFLALLLLMNSSFAKSSSILLMLVHGFCSSLMFFGVGAFFHSLYTRKVYFMNSLFVTSHIICSLFILTMVLNFATPPSNAFVSEFMGMSSLFLLQSVLFVVLGIYIFYVCYFSIYLLVNIMSGKGLLISKEESFFYFYPFLMLTYNFLWLVILF
uniref:NADH-ubiquinone oxidoreductase chain 4 n=1 Tax=Plectus acuminatus TaxID=70689 RepID=A0A1U7AFQ7_PLEAC|nr:NADH dehydrogenase subunit 4 [Plectus acuminatus]